MILVTGATGHVGSELVAQLAAAGHRVRAMTRRPEAVSLPPGVEAVYGDCERPDSLGPAFAGAEHAFLMSAQPMGSAEGPTHDLLLVEAARRAGVDRIVKLSGYEGGGGDDVVAAWHGRAEAAVTEGGIDWTLLRPGRFMSNALGWAPMIQRGNTVHVPFAHRPTAAIDPADMAAVALVALTAQEHRDAALELSGPESLTPAQELAILAEVLDRPLELVGPPLDAVRAGMVAYGMPEPVVEAILARTLETDVGSEVLPTVAEVLGRPPSTFARWARAHAGLFAGEAV